MLKSAAILAVPGVLGGLGLLYDGSASQLVRDPRAGPYVVEVGVAFAEAATRRALPPGLEPAPGFTGGVAIYGGEEGWALSPLSTGYVWIDLAPPPEPGGPSRYMVAGFATDEHEEAPAVAADGTLHAVARPGAGALVEVTLRPGPMGCASVIPDGGGPLLTSGPGGSLGAIHMPIQPDLCEARAVAVTISAPPAHRLGQLSPERVLWAGVATPQGRAGPGEKVQ